MYNTPGAEFGTLHIGSRVIVYWRSGMTVDADGRPMPDYIEIGEIEMIRSGQFTRDYKYAGIIYGTLEPAERALLRTWRHKLDKELQTAWVSQCK